MTPFDRFRAPVDLEERLGDPFDPTNPFSFRRAVELDEQEAYPEAAGQALDDWGLPRYYIPDSEGGRLGSFEEVLALIRLVARRDLTVAIAHGKTYLGSACVWVGGDAAQKQRLARIVAARGQVALGLTERGHGSDLLASEVTAAPSAAGYTLTGEKWLINNATRGAALTVFARTERAGGPRGFSLFLVEKAAIDRDRFRHLPRVKTHGIRGADISGISFEGCPLPKGSLVGAPGAGLELTLKGLQITRTMCSALSLGAADTALRTTLDFALSRRLYGRAVFEIPHARRVLVGALLDLLICDCVTASAVRALHCATEQMSTLSSIVKYFVPTRVERAIRDLSVVLGARHYLREVHWNGVFQKLARDNAIVSLFDGSTVVNLSALALQLPDLLARALPPGTERDDRRARRETTVSLAAPLPPFDPRRLELSARGQDDLLQGLDTARAALEGFEGGGELRRDLLALVDGLRERIRLEQAHLHELTEQAEGRLERSPELFDAAVRYCSWHAAAACLHVWLANRATLDAGLAGGEWVALALARLLGPYLSAPPSLPASYEERVAGVLVRLFRENRLFALVPLPLAGAGPPS